MQTRGSAIVTLFAPPAVLLTFTNVITLVCSTDRPTGFVAQNQTLAHPLATLSWAVLMTMCTAASNIDAKSPNIAMLNAALESVQVQMHDKRMEWHDDESQLTKFRRLKRPRAPRPPQTI